MVKHLIAWGHNPGQYAVKDSVEGSDGKRRDLSPYPAVIAPWEAAHSSLTALRGKAGHGDDATRGGARYVVGEVAQYMPTAMRQMSDNRLDEHSAMYAALVQSSYYRARLERQTGARLVIATALPVGWRDAGVETMTAHIRRGLAQHADIASVHVASEPAAVIFHELLNDDGDYRPERMHLAKELVCVADIGGSTLNRSVLANLKPLPGQSESPLLGSRRAIEVLARRDRIGFVEAEQRLRAAASLETSNTTDPAALMVLRQYREQVVAELRQAWMGMNPAAYLLAGGTALWVADALKQAFGPKLIVVANPQQAIAIGLYRYAKRQIGRKR